jgi:hypothetical protein
MNKIYAILDTATGLFSEWNGKIAWKAKNSLQSSFHAGQKYWAKDKQVKWKEQTRWVAVELTEAYYRLEGLEK